MNRRIILVSCLLSLALCLLSCKKESRKTGLEFTSAESPQEKFNAIDGKKINLNSLVNGKNDQELNHVLIYPFDVCDVCDKDIFKALQDYKKKGFYKHFTVLIPINSYRDFLLYNEEYDLEIKNITPYKGHLLKDEVLLSRATFAAVRENEIIASYTPMKPINKLKLKEFVASNFILN